MNLKKFLSVTTLTIGFVLVTGCTNQPSSTLHFTPLSPTSQFDTKNQKSVINVVVNDLRNTNEIARYTKDSSLIKLSSTPTVNMLFDQIIKQNFNAKGFQITNDPNIANVSIIANISDFYAKIGQGNLRYNIKTNIQLEIKAQSSIGEFTKKFSSTRSQDGAFNAGNDEIQKILSESLSDITKDIYNDNDIPNAINKYTN